MRNALNTAASVQIKGARPNLHSIAEVVGQNGPCGVNLHYIRASGARTGPIWCRFALYWSSIRRTRLDVVHFCTRISNFPRSPIHLVQICTTRPSFMLTWASAQTSHPIRRLSGGPFRRHFDHIPFAQQMRITRQGARHGPCRSYPRRSPGGRSRRFWILSLSLNKRAARYLCIISLSLNNSGACAVPFVHGTRLSIVD